MSRPPASLQDAQRVEGLLRSLIGVADIRLDWQSGSLRSVHILRAAGTEHHQLLRNVMSGLKAGFGIALSQSAVHIHDSAAEFTPPVPGKGIQPVREMESAPVPAQVQPVTTAVVRPPEPVRPAVRPAQGSVPVRRADARDLREREIETQRALDRSPLQLERMDVERHGVALRCRVVLALDGRQYSAIAEVPDSATAEAELAARVTVDALRAGSLTEAGLHGVGFMTIGSTNFVVVSVREGHSSPPRAGAVALEDSMAWSAAVAVLNAVGPVFSRHELALPATAGK